jgi:signal transduction histidine kinase
MDKDRFTFSPRLASVLIWLVLGLMMVYHVGLFYSGYFPGFIYNSADGTVTEIFVAGEETELQIGDTITAIGPTTLEDYFANPSLQFWDGLEPGDTVLIEVVREGEPVDITWVYPGRTQAELLSRLNSQWWMAYLFWLAGLATYLLIRPRDALWRLILVFNLLTALWFTTGSGPSRLHLWGSTMVTRVGIWLTVPILFHLHWVFPKRFSGISKRMGNIILVSVYSLTFIFIIACLIQPEISFTYQIGFLFSLLASVLLLAIHYVTQRESRGQIKIIFRFTAIAFAPIILTMIVSPFANIPSYALGASLAWLPLISFGYFYAISRGRLGALEFRANRAISIYLFAILLLFALIVILNPPENQVGDPSASSIQTLFILFATALMAVFGYPYFQRFIEKTILGIPQPSSDLIHSYSAQITTSQDTADLSSLFDDLILPSLMVRQSALISIQHSGDIKIISMSGLLEKQLPTRETVFDLLKLRDRYIHPHEIREFPKHLHWIKVVLPLTFDGQPIGMWLIGRRDPNDMYDAALVELLKSLAHQTSLALVNQDQTQQLRALYQLNIDRHESERARLARDLHDEALNRLALLQQDTKDRDISRNIDATIANLRKTIHGLRPEMLSYGLLTALQDLGDTLNERQSETEVRVAVLGTPTQFNPNIELHLFRIVQQACENALRHAQAENLHITGQVNEENVHIRVEDDGVGFEIGPTLMLSDLLANQHFGLAGMHERADLINAKINIRSSHGMGTTVSIDWRK